MKFQLVNFQTDEKYTIRDKDTHVFFFKNCSGKLEIDIRKTGARVYIFGVFEGRNQDVFRLETIQRHAAPDTFSELLVKGVFRDDSKFFYQGMIKIEKPAQRSHAYQKNQNLLLSKNALVESKPNLEILADDVFCTHGSATGRQNPEELFYVRSRALNEEKAEDLLVHGFLKEVYDEVRLWRKKAGLQNNNEKL